MALSWIESILVKASDSVWTSIVAVVEFSSSAMLLVIVNGCEIELTASILVKTEDNCTLGIIIVDGIAVSSTESLLA